jgi:hypothetical protein
LERGLTVNGVALKVRVGYPPEENRRLKAAMATDAAYFKGPLSGKAPEGGEDPTGMARYCGAMRAEIDVIAGEGATEKVFGDAPPDFYAYLELLTLLKHAMAELRQERLARIKALAGGLPPLPGEAEGSAPGKGGDAAP